MSFFGMVRGPHNMAEVGAQCGCGSDDVGPNATHNTLSHSAFDLKKIKPRETVFRIPTAPSRRFGIFWPKSQ